MIEFFKCKIIVMVKLISVLIILNILLNILKIEPYAKTFFIASLVGIFLYLCFIIFKFLKLIFQDKLKDYRCEKSETLQKALTWLSNLV